MKLKCVMVLIFFKFLSVEIYADNLTTPRSPFSPETMAECSALSSQWIRFSSALSKAHTQCMEDNKPCYANRGGCGCHQCVELHSLIHGSGSVKIKERRAASVAKCQSEVIAKLKANRERDNFASRVEEENLSVSWRLPDGAGSLGSEELVGQASGLLKKTSIRKLSSKYKELAVLFSVQKKMGRYAKDLNFIHDLYTKYNSGASVNELKNVLFKGVFRLNAARKDNILSKYLTAKNIGYANGLYERYLADLNSALFRFDDLSMNSRRDIFEKINGVHILNSYKVPHAVNAVRKKSLADRYAIETDWVFMAIADEIAEEKRKAYEEQRKKDEIEKRRKERIAEAAELERRNKYLVYERELRQQEALRRREQIAREQQQRDRQWEYERYQSSLDEYDSYEDDTPSVLESILDGINRGLRNEQSRQRRSSGPSECARRSDNNGASCGIR